VERAVFEKLSALGLLRVVERHGSQRVELASERLLPVVLASRDKRRAQEEREHAAEREAGIRDQLQRRNRLAFGFGALALIAVVASGIAWMKNRESRQRRVEAQRNERAALNARAEAEKLVDFMLTDLRAKLESVNQLDLLESTVAKAESYFASLPELPNDPEFEFHQARFFELKGIVLRVQNQHSNALANLARAQEIRARLAARYPGEKRWKMELAAGLRQMSVACQAAENREAALSAILQAEKSYREIADEFGDASARDLQVGAASRAGDFFKWLGRNDDARAKLEANEMLAEELAAESPELHPRQENLAMNNSFLGDLLLTIGDADGALKRYRRAYEIFREQLDLKPNDGIRQERVAFSSSRLGSALLKVRQFEEAVLHLRRAAYYTEDMIARSPHNLEMQWDLAFHYETLAIALRHLGRTAEAADADAKGKAARDFIARRKSIVLAAPVAETNTLREAALRKRMSMRFSYAALTNAPTTSHWDWLVALESLGDWLEQNSSVDAAFAFYEQQRVELEPRAANAPDGSLWRWDLAFVLNRLGELRQKQNDYDAALKFYERALSYRREVFLRSPETSRFRRDVISGCEHACNALLSRRQPEQALRHCTDLIELLSTPERASEPGSTYHNYAAKVCLTVIDSTLQLEPALHRQARALASAAARQLQGSSADVDLSAGDRQLLARLRNAQ
jgi:tetratricopeptide (TPR) repeat protein